MSRHCPNDPQDDGQSHKLTCCTVYLLRDVWLLVWIGERYYIFIQHFEKDMFLTPALMCDVWSAVLPQKIHACITQDLLPHLPRSLWISEWVSPQSLWKLQDTDLSTHGLLWESCLRPPTETLSLSKLLNTTPPSHGNICSSPVCVWFHFTFIKLNRNPCGEENICSPYECLEVCVCVCVCVCLVSLPTGHPYCPSVVNTKWLVKESECLRS